jgi:hypothetical protein
MQPSFHTSLLAGSKERYVASSMILRGNNYDDGSLMLIAEGMFEIYVMSVVKVESPK